MVHNWILERPYDIPYDLVNQESTSPPSNPSPLHLDDLKETLLLDDKLQPNKTPLSHHTNAILGQFGQQISASNSIAFGPRFFGFIQLRQQNQGTLRVAFHGAFILPTLFSRLNS
jgi:hypothetical protein